MGNACVQCIRLTHQPAEQSTLESKNKEDLRDQTVNMGASSYESKFLVSWSGSKSSDLEVLTTMLLLKSGRMCFRCAEGTLLAADRYTQISAEIAAVPLLC